MSFYVPSVEDTPGLEIDYDLGCDVPVTPDRCIQTGGAMTEFVSRATGSQDGIYAMLFFKPSSFTAVRYEEYSDLQQAIRAYTGDIRSLTKACIKDHLHLKSKLPPLLDCIQDQMELRGMDRPKAIIISVPGVIRCALTRGGVLKLEVKKLNLELFVLPTQQLVTPPAGPLEG